VNAGLNFNTIPVSIFFNGQINSREGVCAISDKTTGLPLFYSEGTTVWNRNHVVMPNGNGLLGDYSSTQSSIAIPNPGNSNRYYIFTTALSKGLRYSEIDMTLAAGNGDVIPATKNTALLPNNESCEKLIAVRHCNNKDYWVVSHRLFSNDFVVYLVNAAGVQPVFVQSIGATLADANNWTGVGYLKFSADGSRLAHCIGPASSGLLSNVEILNFDNSTGVISGPVIQLTNLNFPYGAEFSLQKKYLYISETLGQKINQYDLNAADVNASKIVIASSPTLNYGALQMGPDAKIYVTAENGFNNGYPFIGRINIPDAAGAACGFVANAIDLTPRSSLIGLPTFSANFVLQDTAIINYAGNCAGVAGIFSFTNVSHVNSVKWDFGDASGVSTQLSPSHIYATPGTYNVQLILYKNCSRNDTIVKPVTVTECNTIINDYTEVTGFDICKNTLTVTDASAYNVGDTVLLIQMKGTVIDSTNTAAFGDITDYRNAGNYEFNYIKSKTGNVLGLLNVVQRQYDIPGGIVQLVRVPYYQDFTITNPLVCLPWNGRKGGVLVFNVQNTLTFQSDINVNGRGFKGGKATRNAIYHCNIDSFYLVNNNGINGNLKGEGVYSTNRLLSGRGKLANGGGGGNSTNSGGAGGGNGGNGGAGGKQYVGIVCNTNFTNGGVGGLQLNYTNAINRIYLGGGGGAGHEDDTPLGDGGNGGGIVIISAGTIVPNSFSINANGDTPVHIIGTNDDGRSGGGAGGTVVLNYGSVTGGNLPVSVAGGKGDDCIAPPVQLLHGPGGGGGGGIVWTNKTYTAGDILVNLNGGISGVNLNQGNAPWGALPGVRGDTLHNLILPVDNVLFKPNIDSVRFNNTPTACRSFSFQGLGYTNRFPITSWQWYFGDGGTANTQNTSHTYSNAGVFPVKLVVTDINGCKDSITIDVTSVALNPDFTYTIDVCDPFTVNFTGIGIGTLIPDWPDFGDGSPASTLWNPVHTYTGPGNYTVVFTLFNGVCRDTIRKTIPLGIVRDNIIITPDTTICFGTTRILRTNASFDFCWTPATYLDNPASPQPITSAPHTMTYFFTALVPGNNLVVNGNFSGGNTGFTSQYTHVTPNTTEGQYFIGPSPQAWNVNLNPCTDHTSGNGNMMLVNGAPAVGTAVWSQTITVTPNTNYAFGTWIQSLHSTNPADLSFSINNQVIGNNINATAVACQWNQFYTTWNSGNTTSAVIKIVNNNTIVAGNDFALDDISFSPVLIKRDSVIITVDTPLVRTRVDTTLCKGGSVQLTTTGAQTYSWSPVTGLSNASIANPVATPLVTTEYIVTGINSNGCTAKDTVNVSLHPVPVMTVSNDTTICTNTIVQLHATGGTGYAWSPGATLSDPTIPDPVASPTTDTKYYVTITDANSCSYPDSITVTIAPLPVFAVNGPGQVCDTDTIQLVASGGDIYSWQPSGSLNNASIANPLVFPTTTTTYTVTITESLCNGSATLTKEVVVLPLPQIDAVKSNDLDCSNDRAQLNATGGVSYLWSPAATLDRPTIFNPIARPTITTQYTVRGSNADGCINYDTVTVNVGTGGLGLYLMPTGFTPNNDGLNDCYGVKYWGVVEKIEFSIYNRWGERVFYSDVPGSCWNGVYKGVPQTTGVFVYMIRASTICDKNIFRKGTFALIR
jgi:gliding motility-associated-like protein